MSEQSENQLDLSRVIVIGSSCIGKTTFARRLAEILGVKHIEMDALNWLPEWEERPTEELRVLIDVETDDRRWVLDGNYSRVRDISWPKATTIVWLKYSLPVVAYRAFKRTAYRSITKEKLFNGNTESIRQTFFSTESMIIWAIKTHRSRRRMYSEQVAGNQHPNLDFLVFDRSVHADQFLDRLETQQA